MNQLAHIFNALSQLANALFFGGHSNESISGRCFRENRELPMKIINGLFFWQNNHCRGAHNADVEWAKKFSKLYKK